MSDSSSALGPSAYIQNTNKYIIYQYLKQNHIYVHVMTYTHYVYMTCHVTIYKLNTDIGYRLKETLLK